MILDAGPLISADRNGRALAALMAVALETGEVLRTSQAVVAQVWRSPNQANLAHALKAIDIIDNFGNGRQIGELLQASSTTDPVDAHLAVLARRLREPILTGDTGDFNKLAQHVAIDVTHWHG